MTDNYKANYDDCNLGKLVPNNGQGHRYVMCNSGGDILNTLGSTNGTLIKKITNNNLQVCVRNLDKNTYCLDQNSWKYIGELEKTDFANRFGSYHHSVNFTPHDIVDRPVNSLINIATPRIISQIASRLPTDY